MARDHAGLVLVRLQQPGRVGLVNGLSSIFRTYDVESWKGSFVIVSGAKVRIRRSWVLCRPPCAWSHPSNSGWGMTPATRKARASGGEGSCVTILCRFLSRWQGSCLRRPDTSPERPGPSAPRASGLRRCGPCPLHRRGPPHVQSGAHSVQRAGS